jgi:hypothetical protein
MHRYNLINSKRQRATIIIVLITPFLLIGIAMFGNRNDINSVNPDELYLLTDSEIEQYWGNYIKKVGASNAYKEFVHTEEDKDVFLGQHRRAHLFGGALYEQKGLESFSICDENFHYGCMHEFLGRAIADHGLKTVYTINESCIDNFGQNSPACQHGIGHGLVSYFGYNESALIEALDLCRTLPNNPNDSVRGCEGGVFMEYNLRLTIANASETRADENPYSPCHIVSPDYKNGCLFWQSQWWRHGPLHDLSSDELIYKQMGTWCSEFSDHTLESEQACWAGIGNFLVGGVELNLKKTAELCDIAGENDTVGSLMCRMRAFVYARPHLSEGQDASLLCESLTDEEYIYCNQYISGNSTQSIIYKDGVQITFLKELFFERAFNDTREFDYLIE